jgi:hypothetical protein
MLILRTILDRVEYYLLVGIPYDQVCGPFVDRKNQSPSKRKVTLGTS